MWRDEFEAAIPQDPVVIVPVDVDIVGPFAVAVEAARRTEDFPLIVVTLWSLHEKGASEYSSWPSGG